MTLARRLAAEALGTAFLLTVVVGSGIMGERLAAGNAAIALLANSIATGCGLWVLITIFGLISGAHFNPAVTLAFATAGEFDSGTLARAASNSFAGIHPVDTPAFIVAQLTAALLAMLVARWFYRPPSRSDSNQT